jgi:hypothetical protein
MLRTLPENHRMHHRPIQKVVQATLALKTAHRPMPSRIAALGTRPGPEAEVFAVRRTTDLHLAKSPFTPAELSPEDIFSRRSSKVERRFNQ